MFPLPAAWTYEEDYPQRQGFRGLGTAQSQSVVRQERTQFVPPPPSMSQGNQYQFQGAAPAPSTSQTGHIGQGQSIGRGRAQNLQAKSSGQAGQIVRPEKFQFLEKWQNRNFGYKIVISVKNS